MSDESRLEDEVESNLLNWHVAYSRNIRLAGLHPDFLISVPDGFVVLEVKGTEDLASVATAAEQVRLYVTTLGAAAGLVVVPGIGAHPEKHLPQEQVKVIGLPQLHDALLDLGAGTEQR